MDHALDARQRRHRAGFVRFVALVLALLLTPSFPARAGEGAFSLYLQGTWDDFGAALWGPPGVVVKLDNFYLDQSAGARPMGGRVAVDADVRSVGTIVKLAYQAEGGILGARFGAAIAIPLMWGMTVEPAITAGQFGVERRDTGSGLGDIYIAPVMLNWTFGNHHLSLAPGIFTPTGSYSSNRLANPGRNQWGFNIGGSWTWLHPRGYEISVTAGYLINTRNNATNYTTGNAVHVDWLIGHHFSEQFGIGFVGYWYQQVTDDSGARPLAFATRGFRGSGLGLGAAVLWTPAAFEGRASLIGKWVHDVGSTNRFRGDLVMISAVWRL